MHHWNIKKSENIQRMCRSSDEDKRSKDPRKMTDITAEAEEWLTQDTNLQPMRKHLDTGIEDFMDDDQILSRNMDRGKSGSHDFILDHPLFIQWLTTGTSGVLNIMAGSGT